MEFPSVYPSVNLLVIKKYYYQGIYRWNEAGNFIFFYYQRIYRRTKNYRRKIHRRSIFVGDFVGKLITNGKCVWCLSLLWSSILRLRMWDLGKKAKGKGKAGEWGLSIVEWSGGKVNKFCNFCQTRKLDPSLLSLTEFDRVY